LKPKLYDKSTTSSDTLNSIVSCISNIESSLYFKSHIGKSQSEQKVIVADFQDKVTESLSKALTNISWETEFSPSTTKRDSIDIYGQGNDFVVAIELDKNRADQVAKKFVSRIALLPNTKIYFISLCYPGTDKMNKSECIKYFGYCSDLAARMGNDYAGFIVE